MSKKVANQQQFENLQSNLAEALKNQADWRFELKKWMDVMAEALREECRHICDDGYYEERYVDNTWVLLSIARAQYRRAQAAVNKTQAEIVHLKSR